VHVCVSQVLLSFNESMPSFPLWYDIEATSAESDLESRLAALRK
jgi:hypothetical protein